ncbi:MAG: DUF3489 domain-containing protein [bacterium]
MTKSHKRSPRHLSDTALILLGRAADSENQMLLPIPATVKARGMALERTLRSLLNQGFVEEVPVGLADEAWRSDHGGRFGLRITSAGLKAIGVPALVSGLDSEPAGTTARPTATPAATPRPGTKLAQLITMLMQPKGQTIDELSQALGWLPHTTRAAITGLRKSGHVVTRAKSEDGVSVYRIEAPAEAVVSDPDA